MSLNPFPGPVPYSADQRERFFGREDLSQRLAGSILAQRCITVYGPSGAGKSSLMQAGVIPALVAGHSFRMVRVDTWPVDRPATRLLSDTMHEALKLGPSPGEMPPLEAVLSAAERAARRSERAFLIYLDQMERLLYPGRGDFDDLIACLDRLSELPLRCLKLVLSLREDYLGRLRERMRGRWRLLDHTFRVGPLEVDDLTNAVLRAADAGEPKQTWNRPEIHALMLQVREPGQEATGKAEAQAAYAQIVCKALWQERASGQLPQLAPNSAGQAPAPIEAEPIVQRYLDATLASLGRHREEARLLLEKHLISEDGKRALCKPSELVGALSDEMLRDVLDKLEKAAILRSTAHQGDRYLELGHDWLATKLHELRRERLRQQERRRLIVFAVGAALLVLLMGGLTGWAVLSQRTAARKTAEAERATSEAEQAKSEADDARAQALVAEANAEEAARLAKANAEKAEANAREAERTRGIAVDAQRRAEENEQRALAQSLLAGAERELRNGNHGVAANLLLRIADRSVTRDDWVATALQVAADRVMRTYHHEDAVWVAAFSPKGDRLVTASEDQTARLWSTGERSDKGRPDREPLVTFRGHEGRVTAVDLTAEHVVTASADGTARIWNVDGSGSPIVLSGHTGTLTAVAFDTAGKRIVTASVDGTARVWRADGSDRAKPIRLEGHGGPVISAAFSQDGERIVTASKDMTARIWKADGSDRASPVRLEGHKGPVVSAAFSRDANRVVTASLDHTARVWRPDGSVEAILGRRAVGPGDHPAPADAGQKYGANGHENWVVSAAFNPAGTQVVTAGWDSLAMVWKVDGSDANPIVLRGHEGVVFTAAFSDDGTRVVTASADGTARLWYANGSDRDHPVVLQGHDRAVVHAAFRKEMVATVSLDGTARLWSAARTGRTFLLEGHSTPVRFAAFSGDSASVVTRANDGELKVWKTRGSTSPLCVIKGQNEEASFTSISDTGTHVFMVSGKRFRSWRTDSPDGGKPREHEYVNELLIPDDDGVIVESEDRLFRRFSPDASDWEVARYLNCRLKSCDGGHILEFDDKVKTVLIKANKSDPGIAVGKGDSAEPLGFSLDGTRVVTRNLNGTLTVWNAQDGRFQFKLTPRGASTARFAAFDQDGSRLVAVFNDGVAQVWRLDGQSRPPIILQRDEEHFVSAVFHPRNHRVITVSDDSTLLDWDLDGPGHPRSAPAGEPSISPTSRRAVRVRGTTAEIWNNEVKRDEVPHAHDADITAWALSDDSRRLLTAARDGSVRLWKTDQKDRTPIDLDPYPGVNLARFSPDGKSVLTASSDGGVRLSEVDEIPVAQLRRRLEATSVTALPTMILQKYGLEAPPAAVRHPRRGH